MQFFRYFESFSAQLRKKLQMQTAKVLFVHSLEPNQFMWINKNKIFWKLQNYNMYLQFKKKIFWLHCGEDEDKTCRWDPHDMNWLGSSERTNNIFAVCICNFFLSCAKKTKKILRISTPSVVLHVWSLDTQ